MSHTVKHSMPDMKNPGTLVRAFDRLGWKVELDAKCRTWAYNPDRNKTYKWVAKNPAQHGYDLGIVQDAKGNLTIEGDTSMMGNDVWAALGTNFDKLKQQYSALSMIDWVDSHQGTATSTVMPNGVIEMELEVELLV